MKTQDINSIGILGGGVMGGGIGQSAIQAGYNVIIRDLTVEICENTRDTILNSRFGFNNAVQMEKMSEDERDGAMDRLSFTTDVNDLKDCDLIIEAIGGGVDGAGPSAALGGPAAGQRSAPQPEAHADHLGLYKPAHDPMGGANMCVHV